ncbi:ParB/RepB/Spo0J family partition protein [Streptomyces sp. NPDC096013]|uniref:ParB/RepB/Spo0J family partition protein n=1 Tax=Streptomyces sp. NPDC096013 TaxID=3366069 RepID=UPI0037F6A03E
MRSQETTGTGTGTPNIEDVKRLPVTRVPIATLLAGNTPRLSGESEEHIRSLAQSEEMLPPIIVHRSTMRIIDGMHRVRAAQLRGQKHIDIRLYDGDQASCFVLAVRANVAHGLPLSLSDRKAAAARIIDLRPEWSNRAIAEMSGLAAKTVAAMRNCPTGEKNQLDTRIGRDGRSRPVNPEDRRKKAAELLAAKPEASLREIAREVGMSPETVRDVRSCMAQAGQPATRPRQTADNAVATGSEAGQGQNGEDRTVADDQASAVYALRADPAFRSSERGRSMLRMLAACQVIRRHGNRLIEAVPQHCRPTLAKAAHSCASVWEEFATQVERSTS